MAVNTSMNEYKHTSITLKDARRDRFTYWYNYIFLVALDNVYKRVIVNLRVCC